MLRFAKRKIVWMPIAAVLVLAFVFSFFRGGTDDQTLSFGQVLASARAGDVERIEARGQRLTVRFRNGTEYDSRVGDGGNLVSDLLAGGIAVGGDDPRAVDVRFRPASAAGSWIAFLFPIGGFIVFGFIVYYAVLRAMRKVRQEDRGA